MADELQKSYLLDSVAGWREAEFCDVAFSEEKGGICLQFVQRNIKDGIGSFGGLDLPTGFALDRFGNIYVIDTENHEILTYDVCGSVPLAVKCLGGKGTEPRSLDSPRGIAISPSGDLFLSDTGNHRVQVISLKGLILRAVWGAVDDLGEPKPGTDKLEFSAPWDLAIDSQGSVYIIDKGNNRVQKCTERGDFLGEFGEDLLSNPEHIAIDGSDNIYVTDDNPKVHVFDSDGEYLCDVDYVREAPADFSAPAITVDSAGRIHFRIEIPKRILFSNSENRCETQKLPGECIMSRTGVLPGVFFENDKLVTGADVLPQPAADEAEYVSEGVFHAQPLDSETYKCQWHTILVGSAIPCGTSITLETYTCDAQRDFRDVRDSVDIPWQSAPASQAEAADLDFLVQSPPGRYLWFRVALKGNTRETPSIKRIRIFYPRTSYLQYLPRIYQEDPASGWFLERFLSLFEHFLSGLEDEIANIARYFDPASTTIEFLPWLASWLALTLDENWPEEKRRELVKRACHLFTMRGTLRGLQELVELYTGHRFVILEHFKMRRWLTLGDNTILGCNSLLWGKGGALGVNTELGGLQLGDATEPESDPFAVHSHQFSLIIPVSLCDTEEKERAIRRIVELWKPAHTRFFLCKVEPQFRVGLQSMVGVDTLIGRYPTAILGHVSRLSKDSILGESLEERGAPGFALNKGAGLGSESVIN
jgi:phage tail-like protein